MNLSFHQNLIVPLNIRMIYLGIIVAFTLACQKQEKAFLPDTNARYSARTALKLSDPGRKHFAIKVDNDIREYYVHIPRGYNSSTAFPVVFMLHGSGGNGLKFYNISGWVEQGDSANIITVFPSSWKYDCVVDDNIKKHNAEKWNSYDLVVCNNNKRRNDVKFLNKIIDELKQKFVVDTNRIYMVGFSNGGEMAARCAIELSDKVSAIVSCAGALPPDTTFLPLRKLPVLLQMGAADQKLMANLGSMTPLPMDIPLLLATYPDIQRLINSYINSFGLHTTPVYSGKANKYLVATYSGLSGDPENIFRFIEVKDLKHQYPNGDNHPLEAAWAHWEWMKNFTLH